MVIIIIFCLLPFLVGFILEYLSCLAKKRRWLRILPPLVVLAVATLIGLGRVHIWTSSSSPVTQLLIFPGLPAALLLLGMLFGWLLWRRRWLPRVVNDKGKG